MKRPSEPIGSTIWQRVNSNGVAAILTDLKVAMTFVGIAEHHDDQSTVQRNVDNARVAFDTMKRFRVRFTFSADESKALDTGLGELKRRLEALGQVF